MTRFLLFILLLNGYIVHSQDNYPTKSKLQKALTKKTKLKKHIYNSTNWFTVENDSTYRSADTLVFFNNDHYRYGKLICHFVDWNVYKKDAFWVQHVQLCKEPTTATAVKDEDFFTFQMVDKQQRMVLQVLRKGILVDKFEVLALTKQPIKSGEEETTDVLTMRRVKAVHAKQ